MENSSSIETTNSTIVQNFVPPNLVNIIGEPSKHKSSKHTSLNNNTSPKSSHYNQPIDPLAKNDSKDSQLSAVDGQEKNISKQDSNSSSNSDSGLWTIENNSLCLIYMNRCIDSWQERLLATKKIQRHLYILKGINIFASAAVAILGSIFGISSTTFQCNLLTSVGYIFAQVLLAVLCLIVGVTSGWLGYFDYQKKIASEKAALKKIIDLFNRIESVLYKHPKLRPPPSIFLNEIVKEWSKYQEKADVLKGEVFKWKLKSMKNHNLAEAQAKKMVDEFKMKSNSKENSIPLYWEKYEKTINEVSHVLTPKNEKAHTMEMV